MPAFSQQGELFRNANEEDIPFYASMFRDAMWLKDSGFRVNDFATDAQILHFITPDTPDERKWVLMEKHTHEKFAFIHFKETYDHEIETTGGISKEKHNSGKGLLYYVYTINEYFKLGLHDHIHSVILQSNIRSLKINLSIGFQLTGLKIIDKRKFDVLTLTREDFDNSHFVKRILDGFKS